MEPAGSVCEEKKTKRKLFKAFISLRGYFRPMKLVLSRHFLLKCLYQARTVSYHVYACYGYWFCPCFYNSLIGFGKLFLWSGNNLSYVTLYWNSEIWSHKTGGHLIQALIAHSSFLLLFFYNLINYSLKWRKQKSRNTDNRYTVGKYRIFRNTVKPVLCDLLMQ